MLEIVGQKDTDLLASHDAQSFQVNCSRIVDGLVQLHG